VNGAWSKVKLFLILEIQTPRKLFPQRTLLINTCHTNKIPGIERLCSYFMDNTVSCIEHRRDESKLLAHGERWRECEEARTIEVRTQEKNLQCLCYILYRVKYIHDSESLLLSCFSSSLHVSTKPFLSPPSKMSSASNHMRHLYRQAAISYCAPNSCPSGTTRNLPRRKAPPSQKVPRILFNPPRTQA
jgi:hypothetical protein